MGGCKGCHASAQGSGTDFSFLIHAGSRKGKLTGNAEPDVYYSSFAKAVEAAKK